MLNVQLNSANHTNLLNCELDLNQYTILKIRSCLKCFNTNHMIILPKF